MLGAFQSFRCQRVIRCYQCSFSSERAIKAVKLNAFLLIDKVPHKVLKITQGKRGKGGGFIRAKLRNLTNQAVFEKTYTSDEVVEEADYDKQMLQFSWRDGEQLVFLDISSFEEVKIPKDQIEAHENLKEGEVVKVLRCQGVFLGMEYATANDL